MLVTLLIPVASILLGYLVLGESVIAHARSSARC
jgi:drug/metabolite transporter (DMT)-like permease